MLDVGCLGGVKFPFLMNLALEGNGIESVEMLCDIWMPSI